MQVDNINDVCDYLDAYSYGEMWDDKQQAARDLRYLRAKVDDIIFKLADRLDE